MPDLFARAVTQWGNQAKDVNKQKHSFLAFVQHFLNYDIR